jgi:hypothetical protein
LKHNKTGGATRRQLQSGIATRLKYYNRAIGGFGASLVLFQGVKFARAISIAVLMSELSVHR